MNAEHELKVHVERIVRPIVAAEKDKLKMRQELYAHALDALEHEQSRGSDRDKSLRNAIQRLGAPEVARKELQSSVDWQSRNAAWFDRHLRRSQNESPVVHSLMLTLKISTVFIVYLLAIIVPLRLPDLLAWNYEGRLTTWFLAVLIVWLATGLFLAALLVKMGWRLADRSYRQPGDYAQAAGLVLLSAIAICGFGWCFTYSASFDSALSLRVLRLWGPLSGLVAAGVLIVPYLDVRERRPLAEWLDLELAE